MMQVTRDFLLAPLKAAIGTLDARQVMTVFSNVLLESADGGLSLTAANPDMQVTTRTAPDGVVDAPPIAIPARKLYDIVRLLPEDAAVTIEPNAARLRIACEGSKFNLKMHPAIEFPRLGPVQGAVEATLPARELKRMLSQTASAMGDDDIRFWLNGTHIKLNGDSVQAVAQDHHRLSWTSARLDHPASPAAAIIPRRSAIELCKLLSGSDDAVRLRIGYGQVAFSFGRVEVISKLIDWEQYPEHPIPSFDRRFCIDRETLQRALARVAILLGRHRGARLTVDAGRLGIEVVNQDEDGQEVLAVGYDGTSIDTGFNVDYLQDAISAAQSEQIECSFDATAHHVKITTPGRSDFAYFIAQMRV